MPVWMPAHPLPASLPALPRDRYRNLNYHWASTLSGLLGAAMGVVPFVLLKWGHKIRSKSKLSLELQKLNNQ